MTRRVSKRPDVRRDEIMDAALRLCADIGYEAMSIDQVTSAVGVAKGTFYYHFASKSELLGAMVTRWADELFDALEQADAALPTAGPPATGAQRLQAMMQLATTWKLDRLDDAMASIPLLYRPENLELRHRLFEAWGVRMHGLFLPMVEQGHDDGTFAVTDAQATTELVLALWLHGSTTMFDRALAAPDDDAYVEILTRGIPALLTATERVLGAEPGAFQAPDLHPETIRAMRAPFLAALEGSQR